jgi:hypothetical protein
MRTQRTFELLLAAAREVVARWDSGDLAEAVRHLEDTIRDCERAPGKPPRQDALELEPRS